jgi:hypothetical protein
VTYALSLLVLQKVSKVGKVSINIRGLAKEVSFHRRPALGVVIK